MKILITTGIYPPQIGGPSFYAQGLAGALERAGHSVRVATFGPFLGFPLGIRHILFFFRHIFSAYWADGIIALDTFSVALPSVWLRTLTKTPLIIRTGGDFLWEQYVERTKEKILLSEFYTQSRSFTRKEQIIFKLTKWILHHTDILVFSTNYQRDIWMAPYELSGVRTARIENFYGPKQKGEVPTKKNFVCFTRNLILKNLDTLNRAFAQAQILHPDITLEVHEARHEEVLHVLRSCYVVVLVSFSEVSPNLILEAISYGRPVILTSDNGLVERTSDVAYMVNPLDERVIVNAISDMADIQIRNWHAHRTEKVSFVHTYDDIAREFIGLIQRICV